MNGLPALIVNTNLKHLIRYYSLYSSRTKGKANKMDSSELHGCGGSEIS